MDIWSIASGSSGNAYLARAEGTTVLLECGIPMGRITTFLKRQGISPYDLAGVLFSHLQRLSLRIHHRKAVGDSCTAPNECATLYCKGGKCVDASAEAAYCLGEK